MLGFLAILQSLFSCLNSALRLRIDLNPKHQNLKSTFPILVCFLFLSLFSVLTGCRAPAKNQGPVVVSAGEPNSAQLLFNPLAENAPESLNKPYLILISIDGYRWDFNKIYSPTNLNQIAGEGVRAESLQPIYPSKTFPNHYSIITGLYADHHGIVSNEFFDPSREALFSLPDRKVIEDGSWYFGEPLWTTAGRQGMLSASFFWVGAEADILSSYPNYFYRYDDTIPYEKRVDQVLNWLKIDSKRRPHLITLYFEGVDAAAHRFGINSPQVKEAVMAVDQQIGRLREGVKASGLPVNLVFVSDHGMTDLDPKKIIFLDSTPDAAKILAKFQLVGRGPQMLLYLNKGEDATAIGEAVKILGRNAKNFRVWRPEQLQKLNYTATPRVGDIIIEPDLPYLVGVRSRPPQISGANHGWDPIKYKNMHGIFFATGPAFKEKTKLPTFENINIYPLVLQVLGLKQRVPIDGKLERVRGALK